MTSNPSCLDCRYFVPEGRLHNDLDEEEAARPDRVDGECRRYCPTLGQMLTDRHGDGFRHYGEWPKVMGCDSCGEFRPHERAAQHAPRRDGTIATTRPCAERAAS